MIQAKRWLFFVLAGLLGLTLLGWFLFAPKPGALSPGGANDSKPQNDGGVEPTGVQMTSLQDSGHSTTVQVSTEHYALRSPGNIYLSAVGDTYEEAHAASNIEMREEHRTTGAWNDPPSELYPHYLLTRGFSTYELGELSGRTVVSAVLELHLCTVGTPAHVAGAPLTETTTMTVYLSTEAGEITADSWDEVGSRLGSVTIDPTGQLVEESQRIQIPIAGSLSDTLRLVWRTDESDPVRGAIGAAFDLADCYGTGTDDSTTLHLWTEAK